MGEISVKNTKLNFYFFGDIGEYDIYNPECVCSKDYASEILYLIAKNEPFSISKCEIAKLLEIKEEAVEKVINSFELINAIEVKASAYRIKFPIPLKVKVAFQKYPFHAFSCVFRCIFRSKTP